MTAPRIGSWSIFLRVMWLMNDNYLVFTIRCKMFCNCYEMLFWDYRFCHCLEHGGILPSALIDMVFSSLSGRHALGSRLCRFAVRVCGPRGAWRGVTDVCFFWLLSDDGYIGQIFVMVWILHSCCFCSGLIASLITYMLSFSFWSGSVQCWCTPCVLYCFGVIGATGSLLVSFAFYT